MLAKPPRARNRQHYDPQYEYCLFLLEKSSSMFLKCCKNTRIEVSVMETVEAGDWLETKRFWAGQANGCNNMGWLSRNDYNSLFNTSLR